MSYTCRRPTMPTPARVPLLSDAHGPQAAPLKASDCALTSTCFLSDGSRKDNLEGRKVYGR